MRQQRKHYAAEEKVAILRRHFLEKVPVSDLCEETGIHPTLFYRWQEEFFENGAAAFQGKVRSNRPSERERIKDFRGACEKACTEVGLVSDDGKPERLFHELRRTGVRNLGLVCRSG